MKQSFLLCFGLTLQMYFSIKQKKGKEKGKNCWTATELLTGFKCSLGNFETKAKCVEWVHNNIDIIAQVKRDKMNGNYRERFIQPFINYVEANS